ncbi:protein of unknown function [Pseudodesulfovibrio profundus]|uniref:YHS domain-containing protein n=1 Tax=Pseudodesulfovibrio profundus TaxID=57320 RepID=A0A2C8FAP0_9BACT|nr:YHS domain-containing protein [Pseudodesulfovibrio profundus]SOB59504.1 protein of unknown function [Pseudodesulfovibrio profundus]|tara:strand:+ start:788 stop:1063 length:276 start_codon:yes stop_codon:yes gene_type:complete
MTSNKGGAMPGCGPGCGCAEKRHNLTKAVAHIERDPVCGRKVNRLNNDTQRIVQADGEYFFCSTKCMTKFVNNPSKYTEKKKGLLGLLGIR